MQLPSVSEPSRSYLSKSRYVAGVQCLKLLWLKIHEHDAPELQPDRVLQDLFDQGQQVGELARGEFPGGVLIDVPHTAVADRVGRTGNELASGAPAIFEASFLEDNTFVAVDVLERTPTGLHLVEVKSSTSTKPEHITDVAVQLHVLARAGLEVSRASVLHLNRAFRSPDVGNRFELADVTEAAFRERSTVASELDRQLEVLARSCPEVPIGAHCSEPRRCPFMDRCWPRERDHISTLYRVGPKRSADYMSRGIHRIDQIPPSTKLPPAARRQMRALAEERIVVEPGLDAALRDFSGCLGFLDFETIARALPPWPGLGPWHQAAAQFSYHEQRPDGSYQHQEWLADGPEDARPKLAARMIEATQHADRVVTYSAFEKTRIRELQRAVPQLKGELEELEAKLVDLLPIVRNFVYHPDFAGSFSIKSVLAPLVPDLGYDDLVIVDGRIASVEIARLLFVAGRIPVHERGRVRRDLLEYCKRDTWAMVKLLDALRELAQPGDGSR